MIDSGVLYHANLAILAKRVGDYEDADKQRHRASEASLRPDGMLLYEQAAVRCERRAEGRMGKPDNKGVQAFKYTDVVFLVHDSQVPG